MKKLPLLVMLLLTEAVYMRPGMLVGRDSLVGSDYDMLHRWRLGFAREALFNSGKLPAWNPHEVLGAPFAANLQSFPWIPTRLVLLFFDPAIAFGVGVGIAAALAALFTYLYSRRAGLSEVGAAAAGWTFACAGFFSSRVMAGHLPLLEAYPALPLLFWLVDRALSQSFRLNLGLLAVCCACVVSAGHPQVPAYALASAFVYAAWPGRGIGAAVRARVIAAMTLGAGLALAIWWPMLLLIGRSTRILHLAAPDNDVAMPYSRLLALIVPGAQGWAEPVILAQKTPFAGYPNNSYFWDTVSYVGILPLVAVVTLLGVCLARKRMPDWRARCLIFLGAGALVCALPLASPLLHALPGTFLRSPARLLYISTFCAAFACGVGIDALRRSSFLGSPAARNASVAILLAIHFVDLGGFDRWFIQTYPRDDNEPPLFQKTLDSESSGFRVAEERNDQVFPYEVRYDDAGGFDSLFLARFNRAWKAMSVQPVDTNEQVFDASALPPAALEAFGVRYVITTQEREDLALSDRAEDTNLYRVRLPVSRASWFAAAEVERMPGPLIPSAFAANPRHRLILEPESRSAVRDSGPGEGQVAYVRPSSDEIDLRVTGPGGGYVYVLESWDPGWRATLDGAAAQVEPANGFAMAIRVPAGAHSLKLNYETPGRATGVWLSLLSLALLAGLIALPLPKHTRSAVDIH